VQTERDDVPGAHLHRQRRRRRSCRGLTRTCRSSSDERPDVIACRGRHPPRASCHRGDGARPRPERAQAASQGGRAARRARRPAATRRDHARAVRDRAPAAAPTAGAKRRRRKGARAARARAATDARRHAGPVRQRRRQARRQARDPGPDRRAPAARCRDGSAGDEARQQMRALYDSAASIRARAWLPDAAGGGAGGPAGSGAAAHGRCQGGSGGGMGMAGGGRGGAHAARIGVREDGRDLRAPHRHARTRQLRRHRGGVGAADGEQVALVSGAMLQQSRSEYQDRLRSRSGLPGMGGAPGGGGGGRGGPGGGGGPPGGGGGGRGGA
jgi:hypothetical protein